MVDEPVIPTPEEVAAAELLAKNKVDTMVRIVSHLGGVGAAIYNRYPQVERDSWDIQKVEAEKLAAIGEAGVLSMTLAQMAGEAPFLNAVCDAHYGPAAVVARRTQLWGKAVEVKANADLWAALAAFVNGLRARTADRVEAAADAMALFIIESETQTELSVFRDAYGV